MRFFILAPFIAVALTLSGCANGTAPNKQQIGTVLGGVIGGIVGSNVGGGKGRTAAVIAGTMLGGMAGNSIGASLDSADRLMLEQAEEDAYYAPIGEDIAWENPESGNSGTVTATNEGTSKSGKYCREFRQSIIIGESVEEAYGTACQQSDGSWQIVNN